MYYLAFSGNIDNPLFYSFDLDHWFELSSQEYTKFQMTDATPVPGRNYRVPNIPSKNYTVLSVESITNPILVSRGGHVRVWIDDNYVEGQGYQTDFYCICPIPEKIIGSTLKFKDTMVDLELDEPEYPFLQKLDSHMSIMGNISYQEEQRLENTEYNDHMAKYKLNGATIYLHCDPNEQDYWKNVRRICQPLNKQTLSQNFPGATGFCLDGITHNFVVVTKFQVYVYPIKQVNFLNFGHHYEISEPMNHWNDYYRRRLSTLNVFPLNTYHSPNERAQEEQITQIVKNSKSVFQSLKDLARKQGMSYIVLLFTIFYQRKDLVVANVKRISATDTRGWQYVYTQFGRDLIHELDQLIKGAQWKYEGQTVYSRGETGTNYLILDWPGHKIVISSPDVFDPQITIGGEQLKGSYLSSVVQLPTPVGAVKVNEDFVVA